jgi:hypothetical protein
MLSQNSAHPPPKPPWAEEALAWRVRAVAVRMRNNRTRDADLRSFIRNDLMLVPPGKVSPTFDEVENLGEILR